MKRKIPSLSLVMLGALTFSAGNAGAEPNVAALEALGKQVFFDEISDPPRQACATCHVPANGFTAGVAAINTNGVAVPGANPHTVGNRKPPSAAYAASSPNLSGGFFGPDCAAAPFGLFCIGGVFWDGRATGTAIGDEVFGGDADLTSAYSGVSRPTRRPGSRPLRQRRRAKRPRWKHGAPWRDGSLQPRGERRVRSAVRAGVGHRARLRERSRPGVRAHRSRHLGFRALERDELVQLVPRHCASQRRGRKVPSG